MKPARPGTVHAAFAEHVLRTPDAVAVVHGRRRLTYAQLARLADRYAADLARLGVGEGSIVPVRMAKSPELVAVMIAVLNVGGAYALVDPQWPAERVAQLVARTACPVLIGSPCDAPASASAFTPTWWPETPAGPDPAVAPDAGPDLPPAVELGELGELVEGTGSSAEDPYAVYFTSGTTGMPKGVVVPHGGILRLFSSAPDSLLARYAHPGAVFSQSNALPWDMSAFEFWGALANGGTVVLVQEKFLTGTQIRALIAEQGLTCCVLATSVFKLIVEEDPASFAGLEAAVVCGEVLPAHHASRFVAAHPDVALLNVYGPIECSVFATGWRVTENDTADVPIGTPLPLTDVFVVDDGRACAVGEVGEILLGGPGLALGYLGDPATTELKFVQLDIDGNSRRVYRTGDLGFVDEQGLLRFGGRADRQVKIRGFRIEPADAEALMLGVDGVDGCVVLPRHDDAGTVRGLTAYYTSRAEVQPAAVAEHLARIAPAYQIPDTMLRVDRIPLTGNGKLDREALLAAGRAAAATNAGPSGAGPSGAAGLSDDPLTRDIRKLVADCLRRSPETVPDDAAFVDLGADSLDLGRIAARLAETLGRPVALSVMFQCSSVAELAAWWHTAAAPAPQPQPQPQLLSPATAPTPAPAPAAPAARRAVELMPAQSHFLASQLSDPESVQYNCAFAWILDGPADLKLLAQAFELLQDRHEALRARYDFRRGVGRAQPVPTAAPELVVRQAGDTVQALAAVDELCRAPLAPRSGHVWFPFAVQVGEDAGRVRTVFGLSAHHVAVDGTSSRIFARDLSEFHHQLSRGVRPALRPAPTLADVSAAYQGALSTVDLDRQRAFWAHEFADLPPLDLPAGDASAATPEPGPVRRVERALGAGLTARLTALAAGAGVTPFALYLSAYTQTLAELTGAEDFGVLTVADQRSLPEVSEAVGCQVSALCLRVRAAADASPDKAVRSVAETLRRAFAAQDVSVFDGRLPAPGASRSGSAGGAEGYARTTFILQDTIHSEVLIDGRAARFHLPAYAGLPTDVLTDLLTRPDGDAVLQVNFRDGAVPASWCERLAARTVERLAAYSDQLEGRNDEY